MFNHILNSPGTRDVSIAGRGHNKSRYTISLAMSSAGRVLRMLMPFRGIKRAPKVSAPPSTIVTASQSGTMNTNDVR